MKPFLSLIQCTLGLARRQRQLGRHPAQPEPSAPAERAVPEGFLRPAVQLPGEREPAEAQFVGGQPEPRVQLGPRGVHVVRVRPT